MIVITLNSENPPPIQLQVVSQSFSLRTMKLTPHLTMLMEWKSLLCENLFAHLIACSTLDFHNSTRIQLHICLGQLVTPQRLNFLNWPLDEVYACLAVQCNCPWYSLQKWKIGHWWETPKISPSHFPILKCCNSKEHIRGGDGHLTWRDDQPFWRSISCVQDSGTHAHIIRLFFTGSKNDLEA